mgnify:CR=1 FL=1
MIQKNKIKPGDLVIWANEAESGDILEVGVVTSLEESQPNDGMSPMKGAKIIWETGVFWSPLEQIVSVKEYEKINSKR